jgi:malonyl CoA-acyl carrier protein transacylase
MITNGISKLMYIFPGQGAQYVGMGLDIYDEFASARAVYEEASDSVGFDVAALSFYDPKGQLDLTEYCQVALLAHSIACVEAFNEITSNKWAPGIVAGHSLGEYSALVTAKALTLTDAIRLVHQRGKLMSEYGRGHMVAFPLDLDSIKTLAYANYCSIGGCNLPEQTVVCGQKSDLDSVINAVVKNFGKAKAGRFLNTAGAFHSYMMIEAAEQFRPHLDSISLHGTKTKVMSNYTGDFHSIEPDAVKAALFFQIFNPVKWMHGFENAIDDGAHIIIEFGGGVGKDGPGNTQSPHTKKPNLEGIVRKTLRGRKSEGIYLPAINSLSLHQVDRKLSCFLSLQNTGSTVQSEAPTNDIWIGDKSWRLYVPVQNNTPNSKAMFLATTLQDMNLVSKVPISVENYEENIQFLRQCVDAATMEAEPYLEVAVGGCSAMMLHYRGDEIVRELANLSSQMQRND